MRALPWRSRAWPLLSVVVAVTCARGVASAAPATQPTAAAPPSTSPEGQVDSPGPTSAADPSPTEAPPAAPASTPGDPPPAGPPAPAPATAATPDSDAPIEEGPSEDEVANAPADAPASSVAGLTSRERPPRVDGAYVGGSLGGGLTFARVNDLATPTPFFGPGGFLRVGEVLYPWMTLGVNAGAIAGFVRNQLVVQGAFLIEAGFLPVPKRAPLSILVGFGAGGGAVHEQGAAARSGFGGAAFKGALRYDFFPGVNRRRPSRGGGFSLGPELGWLGFTPAAAGRPMSNVLYLSLWIGYYFGS